MVLSDFLGVGVCLFPETMAWLLLPKAENTAIGLQTRQSPLEPCIVSWVLMSDNFKHGPRAAYTKNTGFGVSSGFDRQLCYLLDDGSVI